MESQPKQIINKLSFDILKASFFGGWLSSGVKDQNNTLILHVESSFLGDHREYMFYSALIFTYESATVYIYSKPFKFIGHFNLF